MTDYFEKRDHSEEIQEIITEPPSWLVRWGMCILLAILLIVLISSSFINYPVVVRAQVKINSNNAPKSIVVKTAGKLTKLLVENNDQVYSGQLLAFIETTGNHDQILALLDKLKLIQRNLYDSKPLSVEIFSSQFVGEYGELQLSLREFYQSLLAYKAVIFGGLNVKKRNFLIKDLQQIAVQRKVIIDRTKLERREFELAQQEFQVHKKLAQQKVETSTELRKQEQILLSAQYPLKQSESELLENNMKRLSKERELSELSNQIIDEKEKFKQAVNSFISEIELWKNKYIVTASQTGRITFIRDLEENQFLSVNEEMFFVNPSHPMFYGEMLIPQYNLGRVRRGQRVLIKLKSFPYQEYGILKGKIDYISDIPGRDSFFYSKVAIIFNSSLRHKNIYLKNGMIADGEIVTENTTLLDNLLKYLRKRD